MGKENGVAPPDVVFFWFSEEVLILVLSWCPLSPINSFDISPTIEIIPTTTPKTIDNFVSRMLVL